MQHASSRRAARAITAGAVLMPSDCQSLEDASLETRMKNQVLALGFALLFGACSSEDMPTSVRTPESTSTAMLTATSTATCGLFAGFRLPPPILTGLDKSTAAPGMTIRIYGKDLNPQCAIPGPRVVFAGSGGQYYRQAAEAISNTELRVIVPASSGTVPLHVWTPGGTSRSVTFVYKKPTISSVSPASGDRGTRVTITGQGFGLKAGGTNYVKFGQSQTSFIPATDWTDTQIHVKAPMDFGTGTNQEILLGGVGCFAEHIGFGWLVSLGFPGCADAFAAAIRRFQLTRKPGFLERKVSVSVYTSAGTSGSGSFTYLVRYSGQ